MTRRSIALILTLAAGCDSAAAPEPDAGAQIGQRCADSASTDCAPALSCTVADGRGATCMADCDLRTTRLCEGGAVCLATMAPGRPADLGVCYLGGSTAIGAACTADRECALGAVCVDAGTQVCRQACGVGLESVCEPGGECLLSSTLSAADYCI